MAGIDIITGKQEQDEKIFIPHLDVKVQMINHRKLILTRCDFSSDDTFLKYNPEIVLLKPKYTHRDKKKNRPPMKKWVVTGKRDPHSIVQYKAPVNTHFKFQGSGRHNPLITQTDNNIPAYVDDLVFQYVSQNTPDDGSKSSVFVFFNDKKMLTFASKAFYSAPFALAVRIAHPELGKITGPLTKIKLGLEVERKAVESVTVDFRPYLSLV